MGIFCNAHRNGVTPHCDREKRVGGGFCVSVDNEVLIMYFVSWMGRRRTDWSAKGQKIVPAIRGVG